jgi:hypothetical protein
MTSSPPRRLRRTVLAIIVVGTLVGFLAVFAIWAKRQLLETDTWTETSSELLADPDIQDAVATFLVDALFQSVDVEAQLEKALPKQAKPLAGPAAGGLRELADRGAHEAVKNPRIQQLWEQANRNAHTQLLAIVEGNSDVVTQGDGSVSLELGTIVEQLGSSVGVDVTGKVPEQVSSIEVIEGDQLETAQDLVSLLKDLAYGLTALALALYGIAIYLARGWRREAVRACGFGFIAIGVLVLAGRGLAGNAVVGALATTEAVKPAANSAWEIGTSLLYDGGIAMIGYGVAIVAGAWLAGPGSIASSIRREITPVLRERLVGYAVLLVIVLLVLWWSPTEGTRRLLPSLVLLALLVAGFEALRGQALRDYPDETMDRAAERWRGRMSGARESLRGHATRSSPEEERLAKLERLSRLREAGVLSDDELEREKQRLLSA